VGDINGKKTLGVKQGAGGETRVGFSPCKAVEDRIPKKIQENSKRKIQPGKEKNIADRMEKEGKLLRISK